MLRALLFFAGLLGALYIHWFVPLAVIIVLALLYRAWEALLLGLMVDFLWLIPKDSESTFHTLPLFTLGAIAVVWLFEPLRVEFFR